MSRLRYLMLLAALGTTACSSLKSPGEGFQTSQSHYDVARVDDSVDLSIPYTYRNVSADTVYFINCNGIIVPTLEKQMDGGWSAVWSGATPACLSPPIVVAPGEVYADTVRVFSRPDVYPQLQVTEIDGSYRLVWYGVVHSYAADAPQFGTALPEADRTSNVFTLGTQSE